jgi:hypothetical protein
MNRELEKMDFDNLENHSEELENWIKEALSSDQSSFIPEDFADKLVYKAEQINKIRFWKENFGKQLAFLGGILLMFVVVLAVFYVFDAKSIQPLLSFLLRIKFILLSSFIIVLFVQLGDAWLFKKFGLDK